jgi:hypothetical protein
VGAALLAAAEGSALSAGKTLLVLDTVTGSDGERLYARQGWQRCGEIPEYALMPDGKPCATTIFFKFLCGTDVAAYGACGQSLYFHRAVMGQISPAKDECRG